ncbi:uncharacterized protein LOC113583851 isoform X1 [Electrophorus electricus]|uniref:uncharacterized protein LOC113583851 isoform X1 n=1 Tax=Electrophorus electricus TaxID=8005 RepID=UPI0015D08424|nr:uncharacterized protein LOC113583851 isoform X1 [Electrophorus electricus]
MKSLLQMWTCSLLSLLPMGDTFMVQWVYAPEEHFLLLDCGRSLGVGQGLIVEWRHGATRVKATEHRRGQSQLDGSKHQLFPNGTLYIGDLEETDSGLYYCNSNLTAKVTVLTARNVVVYEGGTLYLSCKPYGKSKQRWSYRRSPEARREFISSWFKNGTLRKEREDLDGRVVQTYDHLRLLRLQPADSGLYLCNGNDIAHVTVRHTESTETIPQMSQYVTLIAVLAVFLPAVVVVLLLYVSFRLKIRNRKKEAATKKQETTNLQLQKMSGEDPSRSCSDEEHSNSLTDHSEIQYASLGRQNWRPRGWSQDNRQQVIYSTLLLTPASSVPHKSDNLRL